MDGGLSHLKHKSYKSCYVDSRVWSSGQWGLMFNKR